MEGTLETKTSGGGPEEESWRLETLEGQRGSKVAVNGTVKMCWTWLDMDMA